MPPTDATQRFSSRVDNYVRFRPGYPPAVLGLLRDRCGLTPDHVIADIGCGTGILARLFLDHGNAVLGVEPNDAMRRAGDRLLAPYGRFTSVAGTAEATGLPDAAADFVTAGQAYHWFDRPRAAGEFARILRSGGPGGWVVLIWNDRRTDSTPFLRDFERLLRQYATDYRQVDHKNVGDAALAQAFAGGRYEAAAFDNEQRFDLAGLIGRVESSSYAPLPGQPGHAAMLAELGRLFGRYERGGRVEFEYDTRVYLGRPTDPG
jgi:SAM-dependent methyltransferase